MSTQILPYPIRLPSYEELARAADIDGLFSRPYQPTSRPMKGPGVVLPPLKVPSHPLRKQEGPSGGVHDRFLDLARHCPAAPPAKEWTTPYSPICRPSPASLVAPVTPVTTALPPPIISAPSPHPPPIRARHPQLENALPPQQPQHDTLDTRPQPLIFSLALRPGMPAGRTKKQALSCFFCRERKIACGRPEDGGVDGRCNQCARRKIACTYPTVSHRGQHSRLKSAQAARSNRSHKGAGPEMDSESMSLSPSPERTSSPLSASPRDSYAGVTLFSVQRQARYGHGNRMS
ncbi:Zn(2)-C6 fungal-type domain-containing protein [Mycena indigotica]|uniref:Zn(2)-C6 fungal-type domain-containing protein n=1 Tax=Mycena indigotica TaxID=2126181 RepID=A0A8H6TD07_9AGAR|nr:Zn(2)-C6 fungal-type domain-containing protein [Mycena indigotica]KAF7316565.1 Zn(2)-C6 fungal-type domain-containing protein [Mycena indigotica]